MTSSSYSFSTLSRLLAVVVFGFAIMLAGCDSPSTVVEEEPSMEATALSEAVTTISKATSLSADQARALQKRVARYDGERRPGVLWAMAADVHDQLTDEQIVALKARVQERRAARRAGRDRGERRRHVRKKMRHRLMGELELTDGQKDELRSIRADYRDEITALRQTCHEGGFGEAEAEKWRALRAEMREAFRDVLTEEQRQELDARRDERQDRREEVRTARTEALNLTDEQQAQFAALQAQVDGPGARLLRHCQRGEGQERPIASILTEEQKEVVMVHRVLRHGAMKGHKARRGAR